MLPATTGRKQERLCFLLARMRSGQIATSDSSCLKVTGGRCAGSPLFDSALVQTQGSLGIAFIAKDMRKLAQVCAPSGRC